MRYCWRVVLQGWAWCGRWGDEVSVARPKKKVMSLADRWWHHGAHSQPLSKLQAQSISTVGPYPTYRDHEAQNHSHRGPYNMEDGQKSLSSCMYTDSIGPGWVALCRVNLPTLEGFAHPPVPSNSDRSAFTNL
jgi:hypothetical protein